MYKAASVTLINKQPLGRRIWHHREIYLFILPAVIWFLIFCYYPMYGLLISFKEYKFNLGILYSPWVGLKWYKSFLYDTNFWVIVGNTVKISLMKLVFGFPLPIIMALMLDSVKNTRYKKLVQTVSYMPHFISWVIVAAMCTKLLSPYNGLVNDIRKMIDPASEGVYYMGLKSSFYPMVILTDIWKGVGWGTIIYLAALSGLDANLYEAASIDGATRFQQIYHITLPCILPTICLMLIRSVGNILNVGYEQLLLLQTPNTSLLAEVIDTYVIRRGITSGSYSYATAIGLLKSVISLMLVWCVNSVSRRAADVSMW